MREIVGNEHAHLVEHPRLMSLKDLADVEKGGLVKRVEKMVEPMRKFCASRPKV